MTTITNGQATQELKLGQATLLKALNYSETPNLSILPSIPSRNKDLVSVSCPNLFQAWALDRLQ